MPSLKLVWYVALFGFITSLTIHICALLGLNWLPGGLVWILSIGVFLTSIPAFHLAGLDDKSVAIKEHFSRLRKVLAACPPAIRYGTILLFLYGITNIMEGMNISFGTTHDIPNAISPIRSLSAVWAAFYAVAGTLSYSITHSRERAGLHDPETRRDDGLCGTDGQ
jgi:hypothetical protein